MNKLEVRVRELEKQLREVRAALETAKTQGLPERPEDVPENLCVDDFRTTEGHEECFDYFKMNENGLIFKNSARKYDVKKILRGAGFFTFPSRDLAEMYQHKAGFLANCLYFKWLYDPYYVPDFEDANIPKWYVYKDHNTGCYSAAAEWYDENQVYFSGEEIAAKCAEWLNMVYGIDEDDE